mmetsp:Transcript_43698/g.114848  ORF Transcript_43698/g.114848 Transcript_43698/m.114848 type:complete len:193 (+) Transcript_43698:37-615(+)
MQDPEEDHAERGLERYAAFGLRIKQVFAVKGKLLAAKASAAGAKVKAAAAANVRYTAYASDVGEGLRPVVPEWAVRASYGLAVTYVAGEIGLHTYHASQKQDTDIPRVLAHQTIFHGIASLGLPMVIIHQAVHGAQVVTKRLGRFTKWGPSLVGLSLIPALPFVVDAPVETAVDAAFDYGWPTTNHPGASAH